MYNDLITPADVARVLLMATKISKSDNRTVFYMSRKTTYITGWYYIQNDRLVGPFKTRKDIDHGPD